MLSKFELNGTEEALEMCAAEAIYFASQRSDDYYSLKGTIFEAVWYLRGMTDDPNQHSIYAVRS